MVETVEDETGVVLKTTASLDVDEDRLKLEVDWIVLVNAVESVDVVAEEEGLELVLEPTAPYDPYPAPVDVVVDETLAVKLVLRVSSEAASVDELLIVVVVPKVVVEVEEEMTEVLV